MNLNLSALEIKQNLLKSNISLREGGNNRLKIIIELMGINIDNVYVLNWIPEQAEDIFEILVSSNSILKIEISRHKNESFVENYDVNEYIKKCSKNKKRKICVAQELILSGVSSNCPSNS